MLKKNLIAFILISTFCISFAFSKNKISETATSLNYSYDDWKEFYTDIIESSKKELYQYSYMRNTLSEGETKNILSFAKEKAWNLISHKEMNGRNMIQSFYVVSPNGHITVLMFANNAVTLSSYEIANKNSYATMSVAVYSDSSSISSSVSQNNKDNSSQKKADAQKNNDDIDKKFLDKVIQAFDEQLSFFDEDVPMKLSDFSKN